MCKWSCLFIYSSPCVGQSTWLLLSLFFYVCAREEMFFICCCKRRTHFGFSSFFIELWDEGVGEELLKIDMFGLLGWFILAIGLKAKLLSDREQRKTFAIFTLTNRIDSVRRDAGGDRKVTNRMTRSSEKPQLMCVSSAESKLSFTFRYQRGARNEIVSQRLSWRFSSWEITEFYCVKEKMFYFSPLIRMQIFDFSTQRSPVRSEQ